MNPDNNRRAMAYFATIGVAEQEMKPTDDQGQATTNARKCYDR